MSNMQQIQAAKDFISAHGDHDFCDWLWQCPYWRADDASYLDIYSKFAGGAFGEVSGTNEIINDDGDVICEATEFEVEISGRKSKSGRTEMFEWSMAVE